MGKTFEEMVQEARGRIKEVAIDEVREKLDTGRSFVLVDVREDEEWARARLPKAVHLGRGVLERDALETLPGVGRKTANVVMNVAFGHPTIAVDTHIFRVGNRTGLAPGKNPLEVEKKLEKVTPKDRKLNAHHWLILHGRYVCKARKPECWHCTVRDVCAYKAKTTLEAVPAAKPKKIARKNS